jgi:large subunit ribosomal protein L13
MNKTLYPDKKSISPQWYLIDAENLTLGRLATQASILLRGKNTALYTPGLDSGNFVIITNAEKVKITGKKELQKLYYRHSGRPGGMTIQTYSTVQQKFPERILEKAIKGMLPKNSLGRQYFRRLSVIKGSSSSFEIPLDKIIKINL